MKFETSKDLSDPNTSVGLDYWRKITDFVLHEEKDAFRLTLKAIKSNFYHLKMEKLKNILNKRKRRRSRPKRRVSILKGRMTRKVSGIK